MSQYELSSQSVALHQHNNRRLPRKTSVTIEQLLLLLSGSVEINPGPQGVKFPCGECNKSVKSSQNSIACDECQQWFHQDCLKMSNTIFECYTQNENLSWTCSQCALIDISGTVLNSSISSNGSTDTLQQGLPKKKARRLRIFTCNFQSIWNKKAELEKLLTNNNIDILIGTETHLSCNIKNAEIIPPNYDAIRKDRNDGYGSVIIIHKNDFIIAEEIQHSQVEIISFKLETYEKPIIISACYRPPNSNATYNDNLANEINSICKKHKNNPIWIGGDFNLPDID